MPSVILVVDGSEYYRKHFDNNTDAFKDANRVKERYSLLFRTRMYELYIENPNQTSAGRNARLRVPIYQYDKNGFMIKEHDSIVEAARDVGVVHSAIYKAVSGGKTSAGFKWKRA